MKVLIKKILKEYIKPNVKIEIIGWYPSDLLEELIKIDKLLLEQKLSYINQYDWNTAKNTVTSYLKNNIKEIKTSFLDRSGNKVFGTLEIDPSNHFYERFFRSEDPIYRDNPEYRDDPGYTEAIDLIVRESSQILKKIMTAKKTIRNGLELKIETNKYPYMTVIVIVKANPSTPSKFTLFLKTQMKGPYFTNFEPKSNIIKSHTKQL
jgi:hypothetical protein